MVALYLALLYAQVLKMIYCHFTLMPFYVIYCKNNISFHRITTLAYSSSLLLIYYDVLFMSYTSQQWRDHLFISNALFRSFPPLSNCGSEIFMLQIDLSYFVMMPLMYKGNRQYISFSFFSHRYVVMLQMCSLILDWKIHVGHPAVKIIHSLSSYLSLEVYSSYTNNNKISLKLFLINLSTQHLSRLYNLYLIMNELKQKNVKFRRQMRKKQLEEYFRARRQEIFKESGAETYPINILFNSEVRSLLQKQDVDQLYKKIYLDKTEPNLKKMSNQNVIDLYKVLKKNVQKIESILLLRTLIEVKHQTIFLNKNLEQQNKNFIDRIIDIVVQKSENIGNLQSQKLIKQHKGIVCAYMDCLKGLVFKQNIKNEDEYSFTYAYDQAVLERLWICLKVFYDQSIFLIVLSLAELEHNYSCKPVIKEFLINNIHILKELINQVLEESNKKKTIALPSLLMVNNILKNIYDDRKAIFTVLPSYLLIAKQVYSHCQDNGAKYFKINNFYDVVDNLELILETYSSEILQQHFGKMLSNCSMWTFFYLLLRIQTHQLRLQIFSIVRFTLKNMVINGANLQAEISTSLIHYVAQGLESKFSEIVKINLEIINFILLYCKKNKLQDIQILHSIQEYQIQNSLQNLEYFKDPEISKNASVIIKLLHQSSEDDNKMCLQQE